MRKTIITLLFGLAVCGAASLAPAAITIVSGGEVLAAVYNSHLYAYNNSFELTGDEVSVALSGYSSKTIGDWSVSDLGNSATFSTTFIQDRVGGVLSTLADGTTDVYFTVTEDLPYTIAGTYTTISNSFMPLTGKTVLYAELFDLTEGHFVFRNDQRSIGGSATLSLGGLGGNSNNYLQGSLTGTLLADHQYEWYVAANTQTYPSVDNGASAFGSMSLMVGSSEAAETPEPASMVVWSLLGLSFAAAKRRRRK